MPPPPPCLAAHPSWHVTLVASHIWEELKAGTTWSCVTDHIKWNAYENCLLEHKVWELIRFFNGDASAANFFHWILVRWKQWESKDNILYILGCIHLLSLVRFVWHTSIYTQTQFLYLHPPIFISVQRTNTTASNTFFWLLALQLIFSQKPQRKIMLYNSRLDIILHFYIIAAVPELLHG